MSQIAEIKANAENIQKELRKLGANRTVALSVHKTKELVAELEAKVQKLVEQLASVK